MTIANTVKALSARVTMSKQDIRARLHEDHVQFREWTTKMAESDRTDERARAFGKLKPALTAHARVEERIAYDGLIRTTEDAETDTLGREGYVEHHIADHLIERLSVLDPATDEWKAHAKVLHEMLSHHIEEEETDIFAKLGDTFSREQLDEMGARFAREKAAFVAPGPSVSEPPSEEPARRGGKKNERASGKSPSTRTKATTVREAKKPPLKKSARSRNRS